MQKSAITVRPLAFVFEDRPMPSTDLYIIPALEANGYLIQRCYPGNLPEAKDLKGHLVIVVRYLDSRLKKLIQVARKNLGDLVYFMDDDLLDLKAAASTPVLYRLNIYWKIQQHRKWLISQKPVFWVSTSYLQNKYSALGARLVNPSPLKLENSGFIKVFYHGTVTHEKEIRWLKPVVEKIISKNEQIVFEFVGGAFVKRLFRGTPRVFVFHGMNWPDFQSFIGNNQYHIGLAPQLDNDFNKARSYTKFLDITRSGAVGIYAEGSASAEVVENDLDGVVLNMNQNEWADAILELAGDIPRVSCMHEKALKKVEKLSEVAEKGYVSLFSTSPS